jgi:hypothetical protein
LHASNVASGIPRVQIRQDNPALGVQLGVVRKLIPIDSIRENRRASIRKRDDRRDKNQIRERGTATNPNDLLILGKLRWVEPLELADAATGGLSVDRAANENHEGDDWK